MVEALTVIAGLALLRALQSSAEPAESWSLQSIEQAEAATEIVLNSPKRRWQRRQAL